MLLISADAPHEIRYSLLVNQQWRVRTVGAHVQGPGGDRRLALRSDGEGAWGTGDDPILELYGAGDVLLTWTPSTHVAAIQRMRLDPGESRETTLAVIDFPGHDIERRTASYSRLSADTYAFDSAEESMRLTVDGDGMVRSVPERWETVATG